MNQQSARDLQARKHQPNVLQSQCMPCILVCYSLLLSPFRANMHAMLRNFVSSMGGFGAERLAEIPQQRKQGAPGDERIYSVPRPPKQGGTSPRRTLPKAVRVRLLLVSPGVRVGARVCEEAEGGPTQPTKLGVDWPPKNAARDVLVSSQTQDGMRPPLSLPLPFPAVGLGNNSIPSQLRL